MSRIVVEPAFWELYPEARIGIVVAERIDNGSEAAREAPALRAAAEAAALRLGDGEIAAHPAVSPWREAYRSFGAKPSRYRSSIEALLRSARAGRVPSISPLVDLYNAVSLRHLLPCGGEDLDRVRGDVRLTRAAGTEHFVPLGSGAPEPPEAGEVVYVDDEGVLCRCWNWREAERTKLTAGTRRALLVVEALPGMNGLETACGELAALVRERLGATARTAVLDRARPQAPLAVAEEEA